MGIGFTSKNKTAPVQSTVSTERRRLEWLAAVRGAGAGFPQGISGRCGLSPAGRGGARGGGAGRARPAAPASAATCRPRRAPRSPLPAPELRTGVCLPGQTGETGRLLSASAPRVLPPELWGGVLVGQLVSRDSPIVYTENGLSVGSCVPPRVHSDAYGAGNLAKALRVSEMQHFIA